MALIALGFLLGLWQNNARSAGRTDFVTISVRTIFIPASGLVRVPANAVADFFSAWQQVGSLRQEVTRLRQLETAASLYESHIENLRRERDALRKMIDLPGRAGRERVFSDIVGFFPSENRIIISVGASSGIRSGLAVVNEAGLIGVVESVEPNRSQVLLISSPRFRIGAVVPTRNPPTPGLLRGENASSLTMEFLSMKAPVELGDEVVTSGFSELIPRGIPIGEVGQIVDAPEYGSRQAIVFPYASIGTSREVFVVK
ncbi:MAG: rod shape-determining protein MreC [Fimbriimonadaceae bacterium]